jgi:murein DD-endopeptidase MepM/ murein hydrolase activator NlpD
MAESHILLLPEKDYFKWVKACQKYVLAFGVTITPDPVRAGSKENITVAAVQGGYPPQEQEDENIVKWLKARFSSSKVDAIDVSTPEELTPILQERVDTKKRYGDPPVPDGVQPTPTTPKPGEIQLFWPTDYPVITQAFLANPDIYGAWGLPGHEGVDIRAPLNANVYSCANGEVFKIETRANVHPYGKHIRVQHANGYKTVYGHLNEILVKEGDKVFAQQLIGRADSTGNSTGHHLHLTLKKEGATERKETKFQGDIIDPTPYLIFPTR